MKNHWLREKTSGKLPSFIRMYRVKKYGENHGMEPIAGINETFTCQDQEFKFGDRDGRSFHLLKKKAKNTTDGWVEWSLQDILDTMESQLLSTDKFCFMIDDRMVKAISRIMNSLNPHPSSAIYGP